MKNPSIKRRLRALVPLTLSLGLLVGQVPAANAQTADGDDPATNACTSAVVGSTDFTDIAASVHARNIECVAAYDIVLGTTDTTYEPTQFLTRGQMATMLANVLAVGDVPLDDADQFFTDIAGNVHEDNINAIALLEVTVGTTPTTFSPNERVTRGQMASFLVRVDEVIGDSLPAGPDAFTDDEGSVHEANINALAAAEIAFGTGGGLFEPTAPVTRGQMASFIARLLERGVDVAEIPPLTVVAPLLLG